MGEPVRRSFLQNSAFVYAAFAADVILKLFLVRFILARLGEGLFATWGILKAATAFPLFVQQGLGFAVFLQGARRESRNNLSEVLLLVIGFSGSALIVTALLAPWLAQFFRVPDVYRETAVAGFRIAALSFFCASLNQIFLARLQGAGRFDLAGIAATVFSLLLSTASVAVLYQGGNLLSIMTAELVVTGITVPVLILLCCDQQIARLNPSPTLASMRELLRSTWTQIVYNGWSKALWELDIFVIPRFFGLSAMAQYIIARRIPYLWGDMQWAGAWPVINERSDSSEQYTTQVRSIHLVQSFLVACAAGFLLIRADSIVGLWLGANRQHSVFLMRILVSAIAIDLFPSIFVSKLFAEHQVQAVSNALMVGVLVKCTLIAIACFYKSLDLVIASTAVGALLFLGLVLMKISQNAGLSLSWILLRSAPALGSVIVLSAALLLVSAPQSWMALILQGAAFALFSGCLFVLLLRASFRDDYGQLLRFLIHNSFWFWKMYTLAYSFKRRALLRSEREHAVREQRFESLYQSRVDPWQFKTSDYEISKYQTMMRLLNDRRFKKALEIGCSEGLFTHQLAAICEEVIGLDISQTAIQRAQTAYPDLAHVKFSKNDVVNDPIPPGNDLVVCGEVLNLIPSKDQLATVRGKIMSALNPGGWLMIVNLNLMPDDRKGFSLKDISFSSSFVRNFFQSESRLRTIHEFETEMYRTTIFEKTRT